MLKKIIMFIILLNYFSKADSLDNLIRLDKFFKNPDSMCVYMEPIWDILGNQICENTELKMKFYEEFVDGYTVLSNKMELTFLDSQYHTQVIVIQTNLNKIKLVFGFNNLGQWSFVLDSCYVGSEKLRQNYRILNTIIQYPDSIKYYQWWGDKVLTNYHEVLSKVINDNFKDGFDIIHDNWYDSEFIPGKPVHEIFIQNKKKDKMISVCFTIRDNKWKLDGVDIVKDNKCPWLQK
ncbi:MAG: hypothetical protein V1779_09820 [bacterium]